MSGPGSAPTGPAPSDGLAVTPPAPGSTVPDRHDVKPDITRDLFHRVAPSSGRSWLIPPPPREAVEGRFSEVSEQVTRDHDLSDQAYRLYGLLCRYVATEPKPGWPVGTGSVSIAQLAADLHRGNSSIRRHLAELYKAGYVRAEQPGNRRLRFYLPLVADGYLFHPKRWLHKHDLPAKRAQK